MKTQLIDGIEVTTGTANIYADLGVEDAEKLKIKTGLVFKIIKAIRSQKLT
jgi:predicted XRE-type DNA-binding protein